MTLLLLAPNYEAGRLVGFVMDGNVTAVKKCLCQHVDPDSYEELLVDWTPLHYAAQLGHVEIIVALLEAEANPKPIDKNGETPLMQAGYWGHGSAVQCLTTKGGGTMDDVPPVMVVNAETESKIGSWAATGHVSILCSAPEKSRTGVAVMDGLFKLCESYTSNLKFGYDWGGSSTAEPSYKDKKRRVNDCCHSVACTCEVKGKVVIGPVDWSDPKSVAGSMWFPKYSTKVKAAIGAEVQRSDVYVRFIEMLAINGGPVSQLERRTMPTIVSGAVADLRKIGISISMLGDSEETKIKLYLRTMEYDEFFARFDDEWLARLQLSATWQENISSIAKHGYMAKVSKSVQLGNLENRLLVVCLETNDGSDILLSRGGDEPLGSDITADTAAAFGDALQLTDDASVGLEQGVVTVQASCSDEHVISFSSLEVDGDKAAVDLYTWATFI
eukprot:SAG11_NODE_37_length_21777_cov_4.523711_9_plen_443_part_00